MSEEINNAPEASAPEVQATEAPAPIAPGSEQYNALMATKGEIAQGNVPAKFLKEDGQVDVHAMANSYLELEKQFSSPKTETAAPAEVAPVEEAPAEVAPVQEDMDKLQIDAPVEAPVEEVVEEAPAKREITETQWGEWKGEIMRDGDLSPETKALVAEQLGLSEVLINDFVQGQKAQLRAGMTKAADVVGGKDNLSKLFGWAANNLEESVRAQVNAGLAGPSWEVTLRGLESQYSAAHQASAKGQEMTHKTSSANPVGSETIKGFGSVAEFSQSRNDPRYGSDARYTESVNRRAGMTDWSNSR
tara:strand:+ start:3834 stop:4745 length:912 start_codon:yes stop_codon:yes gene_type:complete